MARRRVWRTHSQRPLPLPTKRQPLKQEPANALKEVSNTENRVSMKRIGSLTNDALRVCTLHVEGAGDGEAVLAGAVRAGAATASGKAVGDVDALKTACGATMNCQLPGACRGFLREAIEGREE